MIVVNPTMGGGLSGAKLALANATSADVLRGKKFYSQDKKLKTGTRPKGTLRMVTGTFKTFDTISDSESTKETKTINIGFRPAYLIFEAKSSGNVMCGHLDGSSNCFAMHSSYYDGYFWNAGEPVTLTSDGFTVNNLRSLYGSGAPFSTQFGSTIRYYAFGE